MIEQAAGAIFKKDKKINIRLSGRDLSAIQRRALEENIPYPTLVESVALRMQNLSRGYNNSLAYRLRVAGRTAQEFNQRKGRNDAFWEDGCHATAIACDEHIFNCLAYNISGWSRSDCGH